MRVDFPDGREGFCEISEREFLELVRVTKLGHASASLRVMIKTDDTWRAVSIPVLTVAEFTTEDEKQLTLFTEAP